MTLMRWEPMREIDSIRREMDRLFGDLVATANSDDLGRNYLLGQNGFVPAVELEDGGDDLILKLEVPGMASEDLDIQATVNSVSISGERKIEHKQTGEDFSRSEFRYGKFNRRVPLPVKVKNTEATAAYANGVLTLTLPKAESEKDKIVKVNVEVV
jgi:HSP20 family protein